MYSYVDGGRFEGEWVDDKAHGRGVWVTTSGEHNEGEWVDGEYRVDCEETKVKPMLLLPAVCIHGKGALVYPNSAMYRRATSSSVSGMAMACTDMRTAGALTGSG